MSEAPLANTDAAEFWRDIRATTDGIRDVLRAWLPPILDGIRTFAAAARLDLLGPTPHDYKAARVQLRREGWADPLPVAAIDRRARALAARAWGRTLRGMRT